MKDNSKQLLNALYELNPEYKTQPLKISKYNIKKFFEQVEYENTPALSRNYKPESLLKYDRINKLCKEVINMIDITGVKIPEYTAPILRENILLFSLTLPNYSPKQRIKYIKESAYNTFDKPEMAETYASIFQAVILEIEETILQLQKDFLNVNTHIRLNSKEQRIFTYFRVYPKNTIYDCSDNLGLAPAHVMTLKDIVLNEIQKDECKPFIYNKITR